MGKYIDKNYTRYDTSDIEAVCEHVVGLMQAHPEKASPQLGRYSSSLPRLPVTLGTWSPSPIDSDIHSLRFTSPPFTGGTWNRHVSKRLGVCSPGRATSIAGPLASLAFVGSEMMLRGALVDLVYCMAIRAGVCLYGNLTLATDVKRTHDFVHNSVIESGLAVRIHRTRQDKVQRSTKEETETRLRVVYQDGTLHHHLCYVNYDLKKLIYRYKETWVENEKQRERWIKAGGSGERCVETPSEMLRYLAEKTEEWERLYEEAKNNDK